MRKTNLTDEKSIRFVWVEKATNQVYYPVILSEYFFDPFEFVAVWGAFDGEKKAVGGANDRLGVAECLETISPMITSHTATTFSSEG